MINTSFKHLAKNYLFPEISRRVEEFKQSHPTAKIIRLGIGDVTLPLPESVARAGANAFLEMATPAGFKGYGPEQGYLFLREAIAKNDYVERGIKIHADEIFVSDGSKCDIGNFQELFASNIKVGITDPVYPVYVDTNVMAGRGGAPNHFGEHDGLHYLPTLKENHFVPQIPKEKLDLIYLCFPNNPTGAVATKAELRLWVQYAQKNHSLILFDSAYEAYISDPEVPRSIFEIEGANEVAVEFRSFSKSAGFTGTRCAYVVIPKTLQVEQTSLWSLWHRRQSTKFNGVSYPVQRAAEACFASDAKAVLADRLNYYKTNAKNLSVGLTELGFNVFGGKNAPYVWVETPSGLNSWDFFDLLLTKLHLVCTPGSGFGRGGEGYVRFSAFGLEEDVHEALTRLKKRGLHG